VRRVAAIAVPFNLGAAWGVAWGMSIGDWLGVAGFVILAAAWLVAGVRR
jgi:hypothetical protein